MKAKKWTQKKFFGFGLITSNVLLCLTVWRVYRFAVLCFRPLGCSSDRAHTFMVLQPTKSTNVFRFHHWNGIRPHAHTIPSKCMLNNGKIYVIVIKTYRWQLIFQAHRRQRTEEQKMPEKGNNKSLDVVCVCVCVVVLLLRAYAMHACVVVHSVFLWVYRASISCPCASCFVSVFGFWVVHHMRCAMCILCVSGFVCLWECVSLHLCFSSSKWTSSHRGGSRTASKWIVFITKMCVFSNSHFEPSLVCHHLISFFSFFLSEFFSRNYIIMCNNNNKLWNHNGRNSHQRSIARWSSLLPHPLCSLFSLFLSRRVSVMFSNHFSFLSFVFSLSYSLIVAWLLATSHWPLAAATDIW